MRSEPPPSLMPSPQLHRDLGPPRDPRPGHRRAEPHTPCPPPGTREASGPGQRFATAKHGPLISQAALGACLSEPPFCLSVPFPALSRRAGREGDGCRPRHPSLPPLTQTACQESGRPPGPERRRAKRRPGRTPIPPPRRCSGGLAPAPQARLLPLRGARAPPTPAHRGGLWAPAPPPRGPSPQPPPSWGPSRLDPKSRFCEGPRGLSISPCPLNTRESRPLPPSSSASTPGVPSPGSPVCPLPSVFSSR